MDTDAATSLAERLRDRIRAEGPITFAAFMEEALYDPVEGFYARPRVGAEGDFVTSPHVSPAFAALLARQVGQCWDLLGRPDPFRVVEAGAGDGTLARGILAEAGAVPELGAALSYSAVERSPGAIEALRVAGIEAHERLAEAGEAHVVLANELLDNLPFHRLRRRGDRLVEVFVGLEGDRFAEVEGEPAPEALGADVPSGEERVVSPEALGFVGDVARAVPRGYAFLFDYGHGRGERPGEVHGYRSHRVTTDVLAAPGSRDITAAVDLGAVAAEAQRLGFQVWGPVSQREALLGLGMRLWIRAVRGRGPGDSREVVEAVSRASILTDEDKLGALKLLVLGTAGLPAPAAALGDRQTGC